MRENQGGERNRKAKVYCTSSQRQAAVLDVFAVNFFVAWTNAFAFRDTGTALGPKVFCVVGGGVG